MSIEITRNDTTCMSIGADGLQFGKGYIDSDGDLLFAAECDGEVRLVYPDVFGKPRIFKTDDFLVSGNRFVEVKVKIEVTDL